VFLLNCVVANETQPAQEHLGNELSRCGLLHSTSHHPHHPPSSQGSTNKGKNAKLDVISSMSCWGSALSRNSQACAHYGGQVDFHFNSEGGNDQQECDSVWMELCI